MASTPNTSTSQPARLEPTSLFLSDGSVVFIGYTADGRILGNYAHACFGCPYCTEYR